MSVSIVTRRQRMAGDLIKDLAEALPDDRQPPTLTKEQARGGIPSRRGYSQSNYQPGSQGTGGIASPLTEKEGTEEDPGASYREYYTETANLYASDFMLAVEIQPLKKMVMLDNDSAEVVFNYKLPDTV